MLSHAALCSWICLKVSSVSPRAQTIGLNVPHATAFTSTLPSSLWPRIFVRLAQALRMSVKLSAHTIACGVGGFDACTNILLCCVEQFALCLGLYFLAINPPRELRGELNREDCELDPAHGADGDGDAEAFGRAAGLTCSAPETSSIIAGRGDGMAASATRLRRDTMR